MRLNSKSKAFEEIKLKHSDKNVLKDFFDNIVKLQKFNNNLNDVKGKVFTLQKSSTNLNESKISQYSYEEKSLSKISNYTNVNESLVLNKIPINNTQEKNQNKPTDMDEITLKSILDKIEDFKKEKKSVIFSNCSKLEYTTTDDIQEIILNEPKKNGSKNYF